MKPIKYMRRARFVYWKNVDELSENEPFFDVVLEEVEGLKTLTVTGDTLIKNYRTPLPIFPSFETWKREVEHKRRCGKCWKVAKTPRDLVHHEETNHKNPIQKFREAIQEAKAVVADALKELHELQREHTFSPNPAARRESLGGEDTGGQKGRGL